MNTETQQIIESTAAKIAFLAMTAEVLLGINFILSLCFLWNIIAKERGADRIAWMMIVIVPFFGPFAYLTLYGNERSKREIEQLK